MLAVAVLAVVLVVWLYKLTRRSSSLDVSGSVNGFCEGSSAIKSVQGTLCKGWDNLKRAASDVSHFCKSLTVLERVDHSELVEGLEQASHISFHPDHGDDLYEMFQETIEDPEQERSRATGPQERNNEWSEGTREHEPVLQGCEGDEVGRVMGSGLGSGFGSGFGLTMAGLNTTSEVRRQNGRSELFDSSPWGSRLIPDARPSLKAMAAPAIGARALEPPPALTTSGSRLVEDEAVFSKPLGGSRDKWYWLQREEGQYLVRAHSKPRIRSFHPLHRNVPIDPGKQLGPS